MLLWDDENYWNQGGLILGNPEEIRLYVLAKNGKVSILAC